ncbi:glycosyltransferase family 8 protein [Proteus mirabilis]|uniref:glycosyltransferase family 8 protein n=1 Tax=Proteus mirabilis TaxID=584 RepID=UPI001F04A184|nr:glycosyltransferase [Proteus mirabilis]
MNINSSYIENYSVLCAEKSFDDKSKNFNIAYSVDNNFIKYAIISIISIIKNDKEKYHFHIFYSNISDDNLDKIKKLELEGCALTLYKINVNIFKNMQVKENLPISMYFRLIIPQVLHPFINKVLYLDADIICINKLSDIFSYNLKNKIAGVINHAYIDPYVSSLSLNNTEYYFNSGVMLINTEEWKSNKILEKFLIKINESNYKYPDQDVLNILLENKILYLDGKYNRFIENVRKNDNTTLIHYTGTPKPWKAWYNNDDFFYRYFIISPWKEENLELPETYKQAKVYSKKLFKDNKFINAIYWRVIYCYWKIIGKK